MGRVLRAVVWGAMVVSVAAGGEGGGGVTRTGATELREDRPPRERDARRRWALRKMDEMANEALRCRERFAQRRQVETCEADYTRRYRVYNELYLDAARED